MAKKEQYEITPMMAGYLTMKEKYKDCFLFFRLGDFYELFYEDAIEASKLLELTLTGRTCGLKDKAPMCGVPYHAADVYISKLVHMGKKVAICEQMSEPKPRQIVEREVVRVVTPGTITDDALIASNENNYICSLMIDGDKCGISYVDVTCGEFMTCEFRGEDAIKSLCDMLLMLSPAEIITNSEGKKVLDAQVVFTSGQLCKLEECPDWCYDKNFVHKTLAEHFGASFEQKFEITGRNQSILASGALINYLIENQKASLKHINRIKYIKDNNYLMLDSNTRRNLELTETLKEHRKAGSLIALLDRTKTSMGSRLLKEWAYMPLRNEKQINYRLDAVEELCKNNFLMENISQKLTEIYDIQKLVSKISYSSILPKECLSLADSLSIIPNIKESLKVFNSKMLRDISTELVDFGEVVNLIKTAIKPDCSNNLKDGDYINAGYNAELDALKNAKKNSATELAELELKYREETGIKNLKIGYNRVFGYYIEVNASLIGKVPMEWRRKQTISSNERYITDDLKEIENKINSADEDGIELEKKLYQGIKNILSNLIEEFQIVANAIATLDVLCSFSTVSLNNYYTKPKISQSIKKLSILDGRHPVVEKLSKSHNFIPNDTVLDNKDNNILIITGPNMAGKSTYMRQVAVIALMAHMGCFVPAKKAEIPILDRIFTRVGASDDLSIGQSTFMVEMTEMSTIIANATSKSLVLLDEIGRGTSTFDGLSIAWSVVEYIAKNIKCLTMFATHYHELGELEGTLEGVKNYKVLVKEINGKVVFLRKIARGSTNKSFGIEVAALAGLPDELIARAKTISESLDNSNINLQISGEAQDVGGGANNQYHKYLEMKNILQSYDVDYLTPLMSFDILVQLMNVIKGEQQ